MQIVTAQPTSPRRTWTQRAPASDAVTVIAAILEHGHSIYWIAKLMHREKIQIKRMAKTGRCHAYELEMLREILADCRSNVPIKSGNDEQSGV